MNRILILIIAVLGLHLRPFSARAQEQKEILRMDLSYHQQNDDLPVLKLSAKTKVDRRFEPVGGVGFNLFFDEESAAGFMGRVTTNDKGMLSLRMPARFGDRWRAAHQYTFIAALTGNEEFEDEAVELEITRARIDLVLEEKDSTRLIHAGLSAYADSGWVAIPDVEIRLVIRRSLSDLRAGDEDVYTTDENGGISSPFVLDIGGDPQGNIVMGAKIEDHELYGSVVATKTIPWGYPRVVNDSFGKRTLWATRDKTPLWLLIFPNLIIAGVWGVIFYLTFQIYRMYQLGKNDDRTKQ